MKAGLVRMELLFVIIPSPIKDSERSKVDLCPPPPGISRHTLPGLGRWCGLKLRRYFPKDEGMMQHNGGRYFPQLWDQGYRTSRRTKQHNINNPCTQITNTRNPTCKRGCQSISGNGARNWHVGGRKLKTLIGRTPNKINAAQYFCIFGLIDLKIKAKEK